MIRSSKRLRAALLLALQLTGLVVPFADGRVGGADADAATVHVEAQSERSCDTLHLHDDCALCQHVALRQVTPATAERVPAPAAPETLRTPVCAVLYVALQTLPDRGRSPPTA